METTYAREQRRRRIGGGLALILAPLLMGLAILISPESSTDDAEEVASLAANAGAFEVAALFYLAGTVAFVFGTFALVHLLREREPWLGQIGGLLTVTGLVLLGAFTGGYAVLTEVAVADESLAVSVSGALDSNPVVVTIYAGVMAATVGIIVLAVGLYRARTAPIWSAVLLGAGILVQTIGDFAGSTAISIVGAVGLVFALAPLGYELIVEPDEAWEHPARFEGFRPVVGAG